MAENDRPETMDLKTIREDAENFTDMYRSTQQVPLLCDRIAELEATVARLQQPAVVGTHWRDNTETPADGAFIEIEVLYYRGPPKRGRYIKSRSLPFVVENEGGVPVEHVIHWRYVIVAAATGDVPDLEGIRERCAAVVERLAGAMSFSRDKETLRAGAEQIRREIV